MSTKEIFGFLTILPGESKDKKPTDPIQTEVQSGNVFFKNITRRRTIYSWDSNNGGTPQPLLILQPWKMAGLVADDDDNLGHSFIGWVGNSQAYPLNQGGGFNTLDYKKFRATGAVPTINSSDVPLVIGSIGAYDQLPGTEAQWMTSNSIISINDVPLEYTQIGIVYPHPAVFGGADLSTTVGAGYVSFANAHYFDDPKMSSHCHNIVKIASGADVGTYFVRYVDFLNNRMYLQNLDGSAFVGQATASSLAWTTGPGRRAFFNEVSIIQFSAGAVVTGGTFRPGTTRSSFIMRVVFDKTGDDASAAGVEQQGSYFITMRPYTHGLGLSSGSLGVDIDNPSDDFMYRAGGTALNGVPSFDGGINGMCIDEVSQRAWVAGYGAPTGGYVLHWRWKTVENFREVASYTGAPTHGSFLTPQLVLGAGDVPLDMKIGPARNVYGCVRHATAGNAGLFVIKPDLTTLQYTTGSGFPHANAAGFGLDYSRARTGTPADVTTTVATNEVNSASGGFTNADIGRVIVLTAGTNNNGSYKIATVPSGTQVTVVTLAGGAVSFGSGGTGGTFQIGERVYMFFYDVGATVGAGKINYMESLAPGTFFTRTVSMTNGAITNLHQRHGQNVKISVDQATGNIYWLSNDAQQQINKYNVLTNTHSFLTIANVQTPIGGTGTIGTITLFTAILVNSKFDEIWVGTDQGHVKLVKSTFAAASAKRYFGDDTTTYANPAGYLRPSGNRTTAGINNNVHNYYEHPDGRVSVGLNGATSQNVIAFYSREADLWQHKDNFSQYDGGASTYGTNMLYDSIGNFLYMFPAGVDNANGEPLVGFGNVEVQYQWDNAGSKWYPMEVYQGPLPNKTPADTINPGCKTKPIHAALEDVLYGVKLGFTRQSGPIPNNQYLGRHAQTNLSLTDGATTIGSTTFTGSGFTSGDVGKVLRLDGDSANCVLTLTGQPTNTQTVTTGLKTYTFQTTLTNVDGNVLIGATASDSLDNLIAAINLGAGSGTLYAAATTANAFVSAAAGAGDTMKVTALVSGLAGNGIATTETITNGSWSAGVTSGSIYKVTAFLTATTITLTKLDGSPFTPDTVSSRPYTLWFRGIESSTMGPEVVTVLLADGFGKDNTQDISGISYDTYLFKTLMEEQVEGAKFCVPNPLGAPGGQEMKVYFDLFPRVGTAVLASHDVQTTHARALPGAEWTSGGFSGRKLVDGFMDVALDGIGGHGLMDTNAASANIWYGVNPVTGAMGVCPMVDLGADAEVGYVIFRGRTASTQSMMYTLTNHGLKATLYKANGPTAPIAASVARTSGVTNLSLTVNVTTITTSGDFLGAITTGPFTNGSVTAGQNTFTAPASTFVPGDIGKILKITAVGDVGSYRIIDVNGTGSIATVRNLNQTATAWTSSTSGINYEVRDGVREEDVICVPNIGTPTQRLTIERLLTTTTAQVRVAPHTTAASQNWQCAVPTWDKVKRVSYSTEAAPPDVKNNGTWLSVDGREQYDIQDFKIYMDLSDLTPAQRSGRWWQMQMMPRHVGNVSLGDWLSGNFEFYSPTGARIGISPYTWSNNALQNVDFLSHHLNRADFIQSAYNAMTGVAGFNGTADLGGANGDTLTLTTGGNKFLGYQVRRPFTDGVTTAGAGGNFASATAVFVTSDVGRILRIQTGADAGYYRIATRTATTATVTTPSGAAVSFTGGTGATFSIHEGFSVGGVAPDRIVFLDDLTREYTLASVNDTLTTITISEARQSPVTGKQWEIRRPGFDTTSATVDSTKLARLTRPQSTYPVQSGDLAHDSRGALRFWIDDIGSGNSRSNGSIAGGDGIFVGSGFCSDDVGRLLLITTGVTANQGWWRISVFTNATNITAVNAYTGAAVVFTADAAADKVYKIYGDRRFKLTKQVTTLKA